MIPVNVDTINRHFQRFAATNDGAVAIVLGYLSLPHDWPYQSEAVVNLPLSPLQPSDAEIILTALRRQTRGRKEIRQMSPLSATPNECVSVWSPRYRVQCAMMKDTPSTPSATQESTEVFIFDISPKARWEVAVFARSVEVRFCPAHLLKLSFSAFRADKNVAFAEIVRDLWRNAKDLAQFCSVDEKGVVPAKGKKGLVGKGAMEGTPVPHIRGKRGEPPGECTLNGTPVQGDAIGGKGGKQPQRENCIGKGGKQPQENTGTVNISQAEAAEKIEQGGKSQSDALGDGGKPRGMRPVSPAFTRGAVFGKTRKTPHDTCGGGEMMKHAYTQILARKGGKSDPSASTALSHAEEGNCLLEQNPNTRTLQNGSGEDVDFPSFPSAAASSHASANPSTFSFPRATSSKARPRADGPAPLPSTSLRTDEWNKTDFFPPATSASARDVVPYSSTATEVENSNPAHTNLRKRARDDGDARPTNEKADTAFGDSLRSHYNDKTRSMRPAEEDAKRGGLRKFNNMIKGIYLRLVEPKYVLDLACGHGQELLKFNHRGTLRYIGLDSSNEAISEALRRYSELKKGKIIDYTAEFHCRDVRQASAFEFKPSAFNLVCCNFALHYVVSSEVEALELLSRVNSLLKVGGFFALTIVCSDVLEYRLDNRGMQFGNDEYAVSFAETDKPLHWGCQYEFRFGTDDRDGGIKHTEYVVPRQAFCKLAASNGFDVVIDAGFCDMFGHYYKDSQAVADWYGNSKNENFLTLSPAERELVALYRVVMLRKRRKAAYDQI